MSNQYPKKASTEGTIKISESAIYSIAEIAATDVEGVERLSPRKCSLLPCADPITIRVAGDMVEITVHLILSGGAKLTRVAEQVQRNVKENVQSMTGVIVSKVNVVADGISFT